MSEELPRFNFEWASFEQIYSWMQGGAGMDGIEPAQFAMKQLAGELSASQQRLRAGLEALGAGWKGTAADGGQAASWMVHDWGVEAAPLVAEGGEKTLEFGAQAEANRSRMPTLAELEPTEFEKLAAQVPILGPMVDQRARDERRQRVTQEARDRMYEWQDTAHDIVRSVPQLPSVPKPVVKAKPPQPLDPVGIGEPGQTRTVDVGPSAPAPPGTPGTPPGAPGQPPSVPGPSPAPPSTPGPGPGSPGGQAPPVRPGVPIVPPPVGVGGQQSAGMRGAWGPGAFSREEITRSRRTGTGQPGRGATGGPGTNANAARTTGAGGRSPGIMQPAVGRGAGNDDDKEHKDRYADKTDEHFTEGIKKVAPPVIGG